MPNPASGLTLGSDSRSVERTKKFPWNVCMDKPRVHLSRMTASKPIFLVKYLFRLRSRLSA